jgi:hypothetical protein
MKPVNVNSMFDYTSGGALSALSRRYRDRTVPPGGQRSRRGWHDARRSSHHPKLSRPLVVAPTRGAKNVTVSGTPSDQLPDVLAVGAADVKFVFLSMSAREPEGRDAAYLEWHTLDHRPEQHRINAIRQSWRVVSTPECRAARSVSGTHLDAVDHVVTYYFNDAAAMTQFEALSEALTGDRRPFRLPWVEMGAYDVVGKTASPRAVVGADVLPWRPALGLYLLIEDGASSPEPLVDVDGVAGIWWFANAEGTQVSYCYLDDDPVDVGARLRSPLARRWERSSVVPRFGAPFYTIIPFDWNRYLP